MSHVKNIICTRSYWATNLALFHEHFDNAIESSFLLQFNFNPPVACHRSRFTIEFQFNSMQVSTAFRATRNYKTA